METLLEVPEGSATEILRAAVGHDPELIPPASLPGNIYVYINTLLQYR
jgi:hypothetical protein